MSAVGILGWKSALQQGAALLLPDFRDEAARAAVADDQWSPFPEDAGAGQPYPSIFGDVSPSPEALVHAHQVWAGVGLAQD